MAAIFMNGQVPGLSDGRNLNRFCWDQACCKSKLSTIESEYLLSGSLGTLRNRVTGYSMYSFQP